MRYEKTLPLHLKATKLKAYKWWSERKFSNPIHFLLLLAYIFGVGSGFYLALPKNSEAALAESYLTWEEPDIYGHTSREWKSIASSADGMKLAAVTNDYTADFVYVSPDGGISWSVCRGSGARSWYGITSSADGTKLAAVASGEFIYTSDDGGLNWTARTGAGARYWSGISSSADGVNLVAISDYIYTSTDGGVTWQERTDAGSRSWNRITSSDDGTKLAATAINDYIFTSDDGGVTWTERTSAGARGWGGIASSSDGTKLSAAVYGGYIYTSTDSGVTWSEQTGSGSRYWNMITSSADGVKLVAGTVKYSNGYIFTSIDSGVTWTQQNGSGSRDWYYISSSSDGTKLAAVVNPGLIYTSTDSGVTWIERTEPGGRSWYGVALSADGIKAAAVVNNGYIYTSTDSGVSWTENMAAGAKSWYKITSSSDGAKLAAVVSNGYIYTSDDSGVTWIERTSPGSRYWSGISSSADGTKIVAVVSNGYIYTSDDSGVTWIERTSSGSRYWSGISSSADGTKIVASVSNGYIYTSTDSGVTWTERINSGLRYWSDIATSSDGVNLVASAMFDYVYTSTDSGDTWIERTEIGPNYWNSVASSADGTKIAISSEGSHWNGPIYTSFDGGNNWTRQLGAGEHGWYDLALSSNGTRLFAGGIPAGAGTISMTTLDYTQPIFESLPGEQVGINISENQIINELPYQVKVRPIDDESSILKVELYYDGSKLSTATEADGEGVYEFSLDRWPADGSSEIVVVAYNYAGISTEISRTVLHTSYPVLNNLPGQTAKTNLIENQLIRIAPMIQVLPTDIAGIQKVEYYSDTTLIGTVTEVSDPESGVYSFTPSSIPNQEGGVDIKVRAYDNAGLYTETSVHVVPDPWYFPYGLGSVTGSVPGDRSSWIANLDASGSKITWSEKRDGNWDIYVYDLISSVETPVTNSPEDDEAPIIDGDNIIWGGYCEDSAGLCLYNLSTSTTKLIDATELDIDSYYHSGYDISGTKVVWLDQTNSQLKVYDIGTGQTNILKESFTFSPRISGNDIVWWGDCEGDTGYCLYDLSSSAEELIATVGNDGWFDFKGNILTWEDHRNTYSDIYMIDISDPTHQEYRLTNLVEDTMDAYEPHTDGSTVIFTDWMNDGEIYTIDVTDPANPIETRITNNDGQDGLFMMDSTPTAVSGGLLVWYYSYEPDWVDSIGYSMADSLYVDIFSPESLTLTATALSGAPATISVSAWDNVEPTRAEINIDNTGYVDFTKGTVTPSEGNIGATTLFSLTKTLSNKLLLPYTLKVYDAAGNSATKTGNIVVNDSEAPKVTKVEPLTGTTGDITTLNITATDNAEVTKLQISINASAYTDVTGATYDLNVPADSVQPIKVTVKASDASGNSAESEEYLITITDNDPPTITDFTPPAEITKEANTIIVTATDNIAPTKATISFDNEVWTEMTGTASPFTYEVGTDGLASGTELKYAIRVYDAAGNYATTEEGKSDYIASEDDQGEDDTVIGKIKEVVKQVTKFVKDVYQKAKKAVIKVSGIAVEVIKQTPPSVAHTFPYLLFIVLGIFALRLAASVKAEATQAAKVMELIRLEKVIAEDKENFILLSSHYLRTPLTILKGGFDLTTATKTIQERLSNAIASLDVEVKRILKAIENNQYLANIKKPDLTKAKVKAYANLLIWLPLILIAGLAALANYLFINLQVIETSTINLIVQAIAFIIVSQYFYSVLRKKHTEKDNLANLEKTLNYEQEMDKARNFFIDQTTTSLNAKLQQVTTASKSVKDKATPALTEGQNRFRAVLGNLLLLKEVKAGTKVQDRATFTVSSLLGKILKDKEPAISAKKINLIRSGSLGTIYQNPELVTFILNAIIDNAIKFSKEGGQVTLNYEGKDGLAKFTITDQGQGISKEGMLHLFKPFTRTRSAMHFDYEGFGFSLFLSRIIAEHLGGDIKVTSVKGKGTTVTVMFQM